MPIPGCMVRRFLRRQSYAQSAWFVNRVQCQGRFGGSRDRNRPVAMGDMPVVKSERSSQRQGIARTVMLMPGHAARVCGDRRGTGVLTLGSGVLPLSASVRTRVISRPEGFDSVQKRIYIPAHKVFAGSAEPFGSVSRGGREQQAAGLFDFRSRRSFVTRDGRSHLGRNRGDGRGRLRSLVRVLASAIDGRGLRSGIALARGSGIALARGSNLTSRIDRSSNAAGLVALAATAVMSPQPLLLQDPLVADWGITRGLQPLAEATEPAALLGRATGSASCDRSLGACDRAALRRGQTAGGTTIMNARHAHAAKPKSDGEAEAQHQGLQHGRILSLANV